MGNVAMLRIKRKLDPLVAQFTTPDPALVARQAGSAEEEAAAGAGQ
jgi:hypothetical protein